MQITMIVITELISKHATNIESIVNYFKTFQPIFELRDLKQLFNTYDSEINL
jgi:hypothetical protein